MLSYFSGVTRYNRKLGAILIFTPNSWHAFSHAPPSSPQKSKCGGVQRVRNLAFAVWALYNKKCHFDMHCWSSSQGSGYEKDPCSVTATPCEGWIKQSTGAHLSWQLVGNPLIRAPIFKVWIRKREFAGIIHTCPSRLSDWGVYCPAFT